MAGGTPINRQWIIALKDGTIAIDWSDNLFQDVRTGDFIAVNEADVSHHVLNEELDWLVRIGRVDSYSRQTVWFASLPERPQRTLD